MLFQICLKQTFSVLDFESDSTTQSVSEHLMNLIGRPSKRKLATEVINMSCRVRVTALCDGDIAFELEHTYLCGSLALLGKTAPFILEAWMRRLPIGFSEMKWKSALYAACDCFIVDFHQDQGSNNEPPLKHMAHDILQHSI